MKKNNLVSSRWLKVGLVLALTQPHFVMADPMSSGGDLPIPSQGPAFNQFQDQFAPTVNGMSQGIQQGSGKFDPDAFENQGESLKDALNAAGKEAVLVEHSRAVKKAADNIDHANALTEASHSRVEKAAAKSNSDIDKLSETVDRLSQRQNRPSSEAVSNLDSSNSKDPDCRGADVSQFANAVQRFQQMIKTVADKWKPVIEKKLEKAEAQSPAQEFAKKKALIASIRAKHKDYTKEDMQDIERLAAAIQDPNQLKQILAQSRDSLEKKFAKIEEAAAIQLLDDQSALKKIKKGQQKLAPVVADMSNTFAGLAAVERDALKSAYDQDVAVCVAKVAKMESDGLKIAQGLRLDSGNPQSPAAAQEEKNVKAYATKMRTACNGQGDPSAKLNAQITAAQATIMSDKVNTENFANNSDDAEKSFEGSVKSVTKEIKEGALQVCNKVGEAVKARDNDPYRKQLLKIAEQGYSERGEEMAKEEEMAQQENSRIQSILMGAAGAGGPSMDMGQSLGQPQQSHGGGRRGGSGV